MSDRPGPIETLAKIPSALDDDDDRFETAIERLDEVHKLVARSVRMRARRLMDATGWDGSKLLEQLGCTIDLGALLKPDEQHQLSECESFLRLVEEAVDTLDAVSDRRRAVMEYASLLEDTGEGAHGLEKLLKTVDGGHSPLDSVLLGEISAAARAVRKHAGLGQEWHRGSSDPFAAAPVVHLSVPRLDAYIDGRADVLGERVYANIAAHLAHCDACRAAKDQRAADRATVPR